MNRPIDPQQPDPDEDDADLDEDEWIDDDDQPDMGFDRDRRNGPQRRRRPGGKTRRHRW